VGYRQNGELAVTSSTLTTTFSRFLIFPFLLVLLLSVASTVANAQATGQASVKPQPKADGRTPSAGRELSSQHLVGISATRDNGSGSKSSAVPKNDPNKSAGAAGDIEVPHGSFRLNTSSQVKPPHRVKTPYGFIDVRG
jgi:hypothetical protein